MFFSGQCVRASITANKSGFDIRQLLVGLSKESKLCITLQWRFLLQCYTGIPILRPSWRAYQESCSSVRPSVLEVCGRTISVPIPSHSHKTIPTPIPTHSHDKNLCPFPFFPIPLFPIPIPITVMQFLEISKAKKCIIRHIQNIKTYINRSHRHYVTFLFLIILRTVLWQDCPVFQPKLHDEGA